MRKRWMALLCILCLLAGGAALAEPVETPEARAVLEAFLEVWASGVMSDMLPLVSPAFLELHSAIKNGASQNLYWKFSPKKLERWDIVEDTPFESQGHSAHFIVTADIITQKATQSFRYHALVVMVDGVWYVDPDTLASGQRIVPGSTITPRPTDTPEPLLVELGGKRTYIFPSLPTPNPEE